MLKLLQLAIFLFGGLSALAINHKMYQYVQNFYRVPYTTGPLHQPYTGFHYRCLLTYAGFFLPLSDSSIPTSNSRVSPMIEGRRERSHPLISFPPLPGASTGRWHQVLACVS
jgi:hypothetical protein